MVLFETKRRDVLWVFHICYGTFVRALLIVVHCGIVDVFGHHYTMVGLQSGALYLGLDDMVKMLIQYLKAS